MSTVDVVDNIVKVITPLIGVACGVYLVPITEKMKSKAATLQLLLNYQRKLVLIPFRLIISDKLLDLWIGLNLINRFDLLI